MAMRWRWPPENSWGNRSAARSGRPTSSSRLRMRRLTSGASMVSLVTSGSAMMVPHAHPRIQRGERVLEHGLDRAPVVAQVDAAQAPRAPCPRSGWSRPWAPPAGAPASPSSSCRTRTRRPSPSVLPGGIANEMPSTARTDVRGPRQKRPRFTGKCLREVHAPRSSRASASLIGRPRASSARAGAVGHARRSGRILLLAARRWPSGSAGGRRTPAGATPDPAAGPRWR